MQLLHISKFYIRFNQNISDFYYVRLLFDSLSWLQIDKTGKKSLLYLHLLLDWLHCDDKNSVYYNICFKISQRYYSFLDGQHL